MKKIYIVLFLLNVSYSSCSIFSSSPSKISSKTYFSVQPIFKPISPETISIRRNQIRIFQEDKNFTIDATIFGGKSFNADDLATYFLPFGKTQQCQSNDLQVATNCNGRVFIRAGELGSTWVKEGTVDVIANYFGVLTSEPFKNGTEVNFKNNTFESEVELHPTQRFTGFGLVFKQHASRYSNEGFWYSLTIPFISVRNNIGIKEKIIKSGGANGEDPVLPAPAGYVSNMTEALKQQSWMFGKIKNCLPTKNGFSDIYISLGYLSKKEELYNLESFVGLSVPVESAATAEFLWEPRVGNNNHYTIFSGASFGFKVWSNCSSSIYYQIDTMGTMYFENIQTRSFDLKAKPWSRYMWVYLDNKSTTTSPGINVFTRPLRVTQGTERDLNTAFIFKSDIGFEAEGGYHFYARQAEEVGLAHKWKKGPAIAAITKNGKFTQGQVSKNNATINEYSGILNDTFNGVEVYKEIDESDLDLESASHPALISHILYASLAWHWDDLKHPKFIGLGGSYEFSARNNALHRWMAWAKFGISF
jgi:hypothetical protein